MASKKKKKKICVALFPSGTHSVCVCVYACMCLCACVYACAYGLYLSTRVSIYIYEYMPVYVCVCVCARACVWACVYACACEGRVCVRACAVFLVVRYNTWHVGGNQYVYRLLTGHHDQKHSLLLVFDCSCMPRLQKYCVTEHARFLSHPFHFTVCNIQP